LSVRMAKAIHMAVGAGVGALIGFLIDRAQ
jgi:hypothetical protein